MDQRYPDSFRHAGFRGRIGVAQADITPPTGIYSRNWGAARHDVATSVHRPLLLTALVLHSDQKDHTPPLVLLDADLGWWKTPQTFQQFHARLLKQCSLPPDNLILCLSHTHAGPPLMQLDGDLPGGHLLRPWLEELFLASVRVIETAMGSRFSGVLDWHTGHCGLAACRDLPDPEPDQTRVLCGYNPAESADSTLLFGRVTDQDGQIRATLVNYGCHPTTLAWENTAISPDFPGAMRATISAATGAPALFLLGACGELAPRHQYVADVGIADRHGRQLAYASLATMEDMEPPEMELSYQHAVESGAPLAVWQHQRRVPSTVLSARSVTVDLPLKSWPSAEALEAQRQQCTDRALEERLRRKRDIRRSIGDGQHFPLSIFGWRMGDAILVGSSCEPYSQLQQELRARFPGKIILCVNLVNGSLGYLPPEHLYELDIYPVWQTPFERGSLERVIAASEALITQLLAETSSPETPDTDT